MKKKITICIALISSMLFQSCDDDKVISLPQASCMYVLQQTQVGEVNIPRLYVYSQIEAKKLTITMPGTTTPIDIPTESMEKFLSHTLTLYPEFTKPLMEGLNYIDFTLDRFLHVSLNTENGLTQFPNMLGEDFKNSIRYRASYGAINLILNEKIAKEFSIPIIGELPKPFLSLKRSEADSKVYEVLYLNKDNLKETINIIKSIDPSNAEIVAYCTALTAMLNKLKNYDIFEIGFYVEPKI